ncbi:MAG: GNAT family N-acetyltransferase [Lentimonas sp.]
MESLNVEIVRIDLTNAKHREALVSLMDTYACDVMGGGKALSDFVKQQLPDALLERENFHGVLAFVGESPAGLSVNFESFSTFACRPILNIHDFVVAEAFRGRGIAKLLLESIEIIARELGCCKLTLEVLEGNERAQSIYQRFGFNGYELDPKMGRALFYDKQIV